MSFEAITTQEQLDKVIQDRLTRERDKVQKETEEKYADYDEVKKKADGYDGLLEEKDSLNAKIKEHEKKVSDLTAKVQKYESDSVKTRIALEYGIPQSMADRIRGNNEEEMKKDAEVLREAFKPKRGPAPMFIGGNENADEGSEKREAIKDLLHNLQG